MAQLVEDTAESQLSTLFGAKVEFQELEIEPFSRVKVSGATVQLTPSDTVLNVGQLNCGLSIYDLLLHRRFVITNVELIEPQIRLRRDSLAAPLNVQPIIDRLKGDGTKPPTKFSFALQTIVMRGGSVRYDVTDQPRRQGLDINHLNISGIKADINAPVLSSDSIVVKLRRLQAKEVNTGLSLRNLVVDAALKQQRLNLSQLQIDLSGSHLVFAPFNLNLKPGPSRRKITEIAILSGSEINLHGLESILPFNPSLLPEHIALQAHASLWSDSIAIRNVAIQAGDELSLLAAGSMQNVQLKQLNLKVKGADLARQITLFQPLTPQVTSLISNLGTITLAGSGSWSKELATLSIKSSTDPAQISLDASLAHGTVKGKLNLSSANLAPLLPNHEPLATTLAADFALSRARSEALVNIAHIAYNGLVLRNITAEGELLANKAGSVAIDVNDPNLQLSLEGSGQFASGDMAASVALNVYRARMDSIFPLKPFSGHELAARLQANFSGPSITQPTGSLAISDLSLLDPVTQQGLKNETITLLTDFASPEQSVALRSSALDFDARGRIDVPQLRRSVMNIAAEVFPQLFFNREAAPRSTNDFAFTGRVKHNSHIFEQIALPYMPLYDVTISGQLSDSLALAIDAPYIQNGTKLIRASKLNLTTGRDTQLALSSILPNKLGPMQVNLLSRVTNGVANSALKFKLQDAPSDYSGNFQLNVKPLRSGADISLRESNFTINNLPWSIEPAYIGVRDKNVLVSNLTVNGPRQQAIISGVASSDSVDVLTVKLHNINLDYIFETLNIGSAVMFGGSATGTVEARRLFSSEPILLTNDLFVRDFSYAHSRFGDARIRSSWHNESRGIQIQATVVDSLSQVDVDGFIYPIKNAGIDFVFKAQNAPMNFLHNFFYTWASKVGGRASGICHLFGPFNHIDLEVKAMAHNFALTPKFTGVTYYVTDSVNITPGLIKIPGVTIRDAEGHTAYLSGQLAHNGFADGYFNFNIDYAHNLLAYDLPSDVANGIPWAGKVYANGSVAITGRPGRVDIAADMRTALNSDFSFELSSSAKASEGNFLQFRSASTPNAELDSALLKPGTAQFDNFIQSKIKTTKKKVNSSSGTDVDVKFHIDITPDATLSLIMDPVSGDKISGEGTGHVDLNYSSLNEDVKIYGDYVIDRGTYNFSLQNLIFKNFTLRPGSSVTLTGNPLDAEMKVTAYHQVTAPLTDLDESFAHDKELARTNVPVQAILMLNGKVLNPTITFDIDFPTLTSDVKRKVRSIVSTDDMMNRQIIYLLALNRFYTPEYMMHTTARGNEFSSLASGTLSSQLSNILGQLSDKISLAPSLRSEQGDFSDMEFDVALSSTLLNNRLLFNGNFGYRDKSLNNNQFVGDFDAEFLLTQSGKWRLKGFNHFNDRTLYGKQALTTQGLGIMFKHDFDIRKPSTK